MDETEAQTRSLYVVTGSENRRFGIVDEVTGREINPPIGAGKEEVVADGGV